MHPNANPNDARMRELMMRHLAQQGFETLAAAMAANWTASCRATMSIRLCWI